MTRTNTGIQRLSDIRGRTFAFADASSSITVWTKARLVDAGVLRKDLLGITNVFAGAKIPESGLTQSHFRHGFRVASGAVATGEADAGLTALRRFEMDRLRYGLVLLAEVQSVPRAVVARADLDGEIMAAFREALPKASDVADGRKLADNLEWDAIFPGVVFVDDSDFNDLREAMRKAARFDGLPDPFPK